MKTFWKNKTSPKPPYYAVVFVSEKKEDLEGYAEMNEKTLKTALALDGCLGYTDVPGSFISYWDNQESIHNWRQNMLHLQAKEQGKKEWYKYYHSLICKVEHSHEFFTEEQ